MTLPFTPVQFFGAFGAYNRALWPFAIGLWCYALYGAVVLARSRHAGGKFLSVMLAVQWAFAGIAYHAAFFSSVSPAAWLFAALFVAQSAGFAWFGLVRPRLQFSAGGSPRHVVAWMLIAYALMYPLLARVGGLVYPEAPTFGVPCPTTLLTIGFLFAADRPWPRLVAWIPIGWAIVGGSAAMLLGVRTDVMLWPAGAALTAYVLIPHGARRASESRAH